MEPVTHILTGACLARTGLNRRTAYATVAMAIAAEFPDIDTIWTLKGPVSGFQHHRGITHTFLGLPLEAALLLLFFYFYELWRRRTGRESVSNDSRRGLPERPPARWGTLYAFLLLALLSHLLLDYTNNYGIRPFFPFVDRWYAASIVFIFDPLLFLLLLAGLLMPALFGLIGQEVGARRESFRGRGWARGALAAVVLLWGMRWIEHEGALALAQEQTLRAPSISAVTPTEMEPNASAPESTEPPEDRPLLPAQRSLASPDPLSVFRWYTATDFGPAYRLAVADSRRGTLDPGALLVKPASSASLRSGERSTLGKAYLDWSPMPVLGLTSGSPAEVPGFGRANSQLTTITFSDVRFMGETSLLHRGAQPPLTGTAVLDHEGNVLAQGMDGRFQR